jgi:hypothetical protein
MMPVFGKSDEKDRKVTSKVIVAIAHGEGLVLLCEESAALDFVHEGSSDADMDGFVCAAASVDLEEKPTGIYVGELRVVDGGPESWEMPDIRDYYAQIDKLRPIEKEEWRAHLSGEWPAFSALWARPVQLRCGRLRDVRRHRQAEGRLMKVGELKRLLEGVPDDLEIVVRAWDEDDNDYCGTVSGAEVQHAHDEDDTPFFAIDCCPDEEE